MDMDNALNQTESHYNGKENNSFESRDNRTPEASTPNKIKLEEETEETKMRKYFLGINRKNTFTESAQQEIAAENFSVHDLSILKKIKLSHILSCQSSLEREKFFFEQNPDGYEISAQLNPWLYEKAPPTTNNGFLEQVFDHRENCKDGATCKFQGCAEIAELLSCWQKCKETKNLDCPVCGSEILLQRRYELDSIRELEPIKRHLALISNYDGFKDVKKESEIYKKNLFSASVHHDLQNENFSEQQKQDIKLMKLLRILHTKFHEKLYFVQHSLKDYRFCTFPDCKTIQAYLMHSPDCLEGELCSHENCFEIKDLLSHWERCLKENNLSCLLCGDFLIKYRKLEKEILDFLQECDLEVQDCDEKRSLKINHLSPKLQNFFSKW